MSDPEQITQQIENFVFAQATVSQPEREQLRGLQQITTDFRRLCGLNPHLADRYRAQWHESAGRTLAWFRGRMDSQSAAKLPTPKTP